MKRVGISILAIIIASLFSANTYAASGNLSVSAKNVYVGDSFTATVSIRAAAWNIHVKSSGPVREGCIIDQADATADAKDANKTFSASCVAAGEGTITLTLTGDITSAEDADGNAVNVSGTATVTVTKKPAPAPTPSQNQNQNQSQKQNQNKNQNQNNNQQNQPQETPKSNNNKLKEISVDGYELEKVDDNNYTLTVPNDAEAISVNATADDSKAAVAGAGEHELEVGENTIEISITAEDGSLNKITLKVTREEQADIAPVAKPCKDESKDDQKKEEVSFLIPLIISLCFNVALAVALTILAIKTRKKDGGSPKSEPTPYIEPDTNNDVYEPESTDAPEDAPEANIDEAPVDAPDETPEFNEPPKPASINKGVDTVPKNKRTPIYSWSDVYKAKKQ